MTKDLIYALAGAVALLPGNALAQSAIELDEAVVYSGLIPVDINRTGATIEVLETEDLETGAQSIEDALDALPGISTSSNGTLGTVTALRLRGLDGKYIGVTIDGIEVTDPSSVQTSFNFGTLTRGFPGRIELAKGNQTAIYGSDAIAGAINITTWRPDRPGFSWGGALEAGSYGTVSSTLNIGRLDSDGEIALTLSAIRSDGISAQDGNTEADAFNQAAATFYLSRDVSEAVTLGLSALQSSSLTEIDASATDPTGEAHEDRSGARAFALIDAGTISHELAASYYEVTRFDPFSVFTNEFIGKRTKLEYIGTAEIGPDVTIAFGAEWCEELSILDGAGEKASNGAVFGELQYALSPEADATISLRHDVFSDFDDQTTGRAALVYRLSGDTTIRASVGTGYRAPSLYERFGPFGLATIQPETSIGGDLGIESTIGATTFAATAFHTKIEDRIDYDFATSTYNQVPGTTVSQGVELSARTNVGRAEIYGNYTYTNAEIDGTRLLRVPRHDLTLGLAAPITANITGALEVRHVRDRLDVNDAFATVAADDYTVANATISYAVNDNAEAYLRVENLFDEDYQTANSFNTPDRSFYVGLRASF